MDIDGHLRNAREAARVAEVRAAAEAERLMTDTTASIRQLRAAFSEFIDALIRHDVPRWQLVCLDTSWVPQRRGLFKSTPGHAQMSAVSLGSCWPFGGTLLFEDESILDATGVKVGSRIIPYDSYAPSVRTGFLELSRSALGAAGLGSEISEDCLYIVKDSKRLDQLRDMDWSTVRTTSGPQGLLLRVHQDEYEVAAGEVSVRRDGRDEMGTVTVPMDRAIADYISNAERYGRKAHGLTNQ